MSDAGRLDPADDLHDDVDVGIADHALGVVGEAARREREVAVLGEVADRDAGDLERHAGAGLDHVGVIVDEAHQRAPHVAAAEDPDPHPFLHDGSVSLMSVSRVDEIVEVSRRTTTRALPSRTNTTAGRGTWL